MTAQEHFEQHAAKDWCDICYLAWLFRRLTRIFGDHPDMHKRLVDVADKIEKGNH